VLRSAAWRSWCVSQSYSVLRQWEWHGERQSKCAENKGVISPRERGFCVAGNTPWLRGRASGAHVWPRSESELL
jgi:hypothetical protein